MIDHTWSPDDSHLAFVGETTENGARRFDVYVMRADQTGLRRITTDGTYKWDPEWRADGRIAFIQQNPPGEAASRDVYSVHSTALTGAQAQRETRGTDANAISYVESSAGGGLAYVSRPDIYTSNGVPIPDRLIVEGRELLERPPGTTHGMDWAPGSRPTILSWPGASWRSSTARGGPCARCR